MLVHTIPSCRICGNTKFTPLLDLGFQALTGVFPRHKDERIEDGPLELIKCDESTGGCGLVQLRHSYAPEKMYGENYGYRSGLNRSMVRHLKNRIENVIQIAQPKAGDFVLDIGSNDGTSLGFYSADLTRVGIDPSGSKFAHHYAAGITLIPDFFKAETIRKQLPGRKAKIITSFAMFYDLERPLDFMKEIADTLADDGIWAFEQSYLPAMLEANAYDTICHEHLSYYAMKQIYWMTERSGLKIIDIEINDINGGSFCVTVAKKESSYPEATEQIGILLDTENQMKIHSEVGFAPFRDAVMSHRDELRSFIAESKLRGKKLYGYGASTKGNVLLQFCGFRLWDLPAIAEVNTDKFGSYTPGTTIPILSEAEVHQANPDYLLVLPWHFRDEILKRETAFLARGGRIVFPLPHLEVVGAKELWETTHRLNRDDKKELPQLRRAS